MRIKRLQLTPLARLVLEVEEVSSPYGRKFQIIGELASAKGEEVPVVTIWILSSNAAAPRFVTAYPLE